MSESEVVPQPGADLLSQAITDSVRDDRRRLVEAKKAVFEYLKEIDAAGGDIDLRKVMFEKHNISGSDTLAALRELTWEGGVEMGSDFEYRVARSP